ncbi:MAG: hypothetical protein A2V90_01700 [Gammaproteobacteria bacterium RBG_16_57_12]|nr:MAG: hypothetical protein A2V90_01700 [Gammaproteobacteria bacterium RBG_16_57_12]
MDAAADANPQLMLKLPLAVKQLGMSVHQGFDDLAQAAQHGATREELLQRLSTQLNVCKSCHAGYRLQADTEKP